MRQRTKEEHKIPLFLFLATVEEIQSLFWEKKVPSLCQSLVAYTLGITQTIKKKKNLFHF